ncbi:MAG: GNAT family N-acetyltransferase [Pseudoruegeria sp.]
MKKLKLTYQLKDMDTEAVSHAIQNEYWGKTLSANKLLAAYETSFCVGALLDGKQIGFARAVSDTVTCSYVRDLVVFKDFRGRGYGRRLMNGLIDHPELGDVRSWFLGTKDAHAFYEGSGFKKSPDGIYMFLHRP